MDATRCMKCNSENIDASPPDVSSNEAYVEVVCQDCDACYTERWELAEQFDGGIE